MIVGGWFLGVSPKKRGKIALHFDLALKFGLNLPKTMLYLAWAGA